MKLIRYNLAWVFSPFCISAFLILLEPFGTTFRNTSAILLALSYGILSIATLFLLNRTLKKHLFKKCNALKPIALYTIWYLIVLTSISLINFLYFGLWACHCEIEYKLTLFISQFAPRTFILGSFIIITDRILEYFPNSIDISNSNIEDKNKNIIAITSFGNYLRIKSVEGDNVKEVIERGTLTSCNKKYSSNFFRCHRSHIINIHYLKKIVKKNRKYIAILECDIKIPVSSSKINELIPLVKT